MKRLVPALMVLLGGTAACVDDLDPPSRIDRNRVLGARVEVVGDEGRASPMSEEEVVVRWLVVDPADRAPLSFAFRACVAKEVRVGAAPCDEPPFADTDASTPAVQEPRFAFTVPADRTDPFTILVEGLVCADGRPMLTESLDDARCDGADAQENLVRLTIDVNPDEENRHPGLDGSTFFVDGEPWPESPATPLEPCTAAVIPQVEWRSELPIAVTVEPEAREPTGNGETESLELSHFVTAGELNRPRTLLGELDVEAMLTWEPGAPPDLAESRLVRAFFVLRDGRGGTTWTTRALCLRAPP